MDNLDFRKFLTEYGLSYEEYETMTEEEKQQLVDRFKKGKQINARAEKAENLKKIGAGIQGCGCLIMLIPVLLILLFILFTFIKGMF